MFSLDDAAGPAVLSFSTGFLFGMRSCFGFLKTFEPFLSRLSRAFLLRPLLECGDAGEYF